VVGSNNYLKYIGTSLKLSLLKTNYGVPNMQKKCYRPNNWRDYNKSLVKRGSLTVWFDKNSVASWYSKEETGERGRPELYSDLAIECCLTLKMVFHLPLRASEGFVSSLLELLNLPLKAPNYSLLSLRQKNLTLPSLKREQLSGNKHLVIDSTGLKLYGEGEWKVRKHGKSKRRTWLKLHLTIDEKTQEIEAYVLTGDDVHDCETLPEMLRQVRGDIFQVTGDGAYDTHGSYAAVINVGAKPCFPPRVNAIKHKAVDEAWRLRNHAISHVRYHDLEHWKKKNNYHRRSLSETCMFRFKQLLGDKVQARTFERQKTEIGIKCRMINKINKLGMPVTMVV
jgi:hypothetical protein